MTVEFHWAVSTRQQNQRALMRRAYVQNCLYLLEGTSHCNTLREEFSIVPCESERESEDEPDTTTDVGLLPDAREQSHHETDKTMEVDSRVVKCAGACKHCVSHVVTRFRTDIRFTRLLSPICTLLIRTYSLCRFHKFPVNGLLVSLRSSRQLRASLGNDKLETFML